VYSWSGVEQFKLTELLTGSVNLPFGRPGGYFFMNKETFGKLPANAQQAIDKFSGEEPSRVIGKELDDLDTGARARMVADPAKFREFNLETAEIDRLRQVLAPITSDWVAAVPNGAAVLEAFKKEVARIRNP
jgi:TRAP-type C4-dicarboxylate transport system substrate-binding protein